MTRDEHEAVVITFLRSVEEKTALPENGTSGNSDHEPVWMSLPVGRQATNVGLHAGRAQMTDTALIYTLGDADHRVVQDRPLTMRQGCRPDQD